MNNETRNTDNYYESKEFDSYQENFEMFCEELEKLSKKHGIAIQTIGGVAYGKIDAIRYDADLSSGDLTHRIKWGE